MDLYAFTDTMSSPSPIAIPSPFLIAKSRPKEWKQQQTESSIFTNHNKLKTRAALGRAEKNFVNAANSGHLAHSIPDGPYCAPQTAQDDFANGL
jgi:hypothetical protein